MRKMVLCAMLALLGCDRQPNSASAPPPPPATEPVATATAPASPSAAQASADASAVGSVLSIDGKSVNFPLARLRIVHDGAKLSAILYTADPTSAISNDYTGNSYYLVMPLEITDPADIGSAECQLKAASQDEPSATDGIFLHGRQAHLTPYNVGVKFTGGGGGGGLVVQLQITGQFEVYAQGVSQPSRQSMVMGHVIAAIEQR